MGKVYEAPGRPGSVVTVKPRYDNFIGGKWIAPVKGKYMANISPVNGKPFCEVAKSTPEDVELALDAAHAAKNAWGDTSLAGRAAVLNRIADVLEANLELVRRGLVLYTFGNASGAAYITNALICSSNNCNSFAAIAAAGYGSNAMSSLPAMTSAGNKPAGAAVAGAIVALLLPLLI